MGDSLRLYAKRHLVDLEPCYSAHVSAMTTEGLHSKSDIAAELAWRDKEIERLVVALAELLNKWDSIPEETGWDQSIAREMVRVCARELREALKGDSGEWAKVD